MLLPFFALLLNGLVVSSMSASSFAGSTQTAQYPPPGAPSIFFPDAQQVGFAGPTPTGDEAAAIVTAPVFAKLDNIFPLVQPKTADNKARNSFDILGHLGNLGPVQSVSSFGLPKSSPNIPKSCQIDAIHVIYRHGARYPTSGSAPAEFAAGLHAIADSTGFNASGPLAFLNTWTFKLGAEILTPFGRGQLFNLGVGFRVRYGELLKKFTRLPVFRTTSEARMVDSALNFAAGFFGVQYATEYSQLIEIESIGFNTTLAPYDVCPNANNEIADFGTVQANKWAAKYLGPAVQRLNQYISGVQFNFTHLVAMQQLCAYETVSLGYSAFCDLFTQAEWEGYEYLNDLQFWYGNGPGNPASSALGIGYVQELVSRLTRTTITTADTTVNATIVGNATMFPLDQPIYVDASHDTVITAILTAMNFTSLARNGPLPTDSIPKDQTYFVNELAPFGSNLVGQVLTCNAASEPSHIRWILNDAVLPLTGIQGCGENQDGLCKLDTFISSMKKRIAQVDFTFDCFGNYSIPIPDTIIDGRFPK
ncbi:histidine phosphatase superfamily [Mycena floridula]|nr:histidine phosphatase superfamily [Mycena floridula]